MNIFVLHHSRSDISHLTRGLDIPHGLTRPKGLTTKDIMIQWGAADADKGCIKLNSTSSIERTKDEIGLKRILALNGIACSPTNEQAKDHTIQQYVIPIFHLEALAIYRSQVGLHAKAQKLEQNVKSRFIRRLIRQAIRTVYCLGLDFAVVTLSAQKVASPMILRVEPAPILTPESGVLFAQAIQRFAYDCTHKPFKNTQALLGMDPEFMLCRADGKIVSAAQYLRKEGRAGYDGIRVKGKIVYPLVELRPKPSVEPRQLVIHLMQTMRTASNRINNHDLSWIAGGMPKKGFSLGGHLHMSSIWLNAWLLRALDNYLALPLILIEAACSRGRRPRYGFLGDFRHQFHGGFEYRSLPSWIVTPRITKGVIALARIITDHYDELKQTPLEKESVQAYYYHGEKQPLLPVVLRLWSDLQRLQSYERYESYLEPLKKQIFAMQPWDEAQDLRRLWRIPPFR